MNFVANTLPPRLQSGFTLIELSLVVLLSAFLITGMVQIVSAASGSFRLQDNQSEVMENGRYAIATMSKSIRRAGFSPEPWNPAFTRDGLMPGTVDRISSRSDRLILRSWSDTNCYDHQNPVRDENGRPAFHIRESLFDLNSVGDLAHTCRYGPDDAELITQINHNGFVRNAESFQALYGEDTTADGLVDRWVKGSEWAAADQVLAVRIGLLLKSSDPVVEKTTQSFGVLDHTHQSRADGRLRHLFVFTSVIRSNQR